MGQAGEGKEVSTGHRRDAREAHRWPFWWRLFEPLKIGVVRLATKVDRFCDLAEGVVSCFHIEFVRDSVQCWGKLPRLGKGRGGIGRTGVGVGSKTGVTVEDAIEDK